MHPVTCSLLLVRSLFDRFSNSDFGGKWPLKSKVSKNVFPDSATGHRTMFRDQIWWKSAVAKLPKGPLESGLGLPHKKVGLRGIRPSPHFAQNGLIAPKFPWTLSPLDMSTYTEFGPDLNYVIFIRQVDWGGVWWLQWKPTFFHCTLIYFCQYNPGEIPGLQIHQSRIPGLRKGIRDWNLYSEASETEISAKAIENSRSGIRGKWGSLNSQSGILKTSGLLKNFVRNFDKILQNSPHLLL